MKPLEASVADCELEVEYEMHTKDFFMQVGMLIMEGRTPELSEKGRVEGKHCPSLTGMVTHQCHNQKECHEVLSMKQQMESLWNKEQCLYIDVVVQLDAEDDSVVLMEQWTIEMVGSASGHVTCCSMLMQAVRSHIHFSQLSAWLSCSKGTHPKNIKYIIRQPDAATQQLSFFREPASHVFPLASLPGNCAICVMVKSLPRCDPSQLLNDLQWKLNEQSMREQQLSTRTWPCKVTDTRSPLRKKTCLGDTDSKKGSKYEDNSPCASARAKLFPCALSREREPNGISPSVSNGLSSTSSKNIATSSSNGIFNLGQRLINLDATISKIDNLDFNEFDSGLQCKKSTNEKIESILNRCKDKDSQCSYGSENQGIAKFMLDRKTRSLSEGAAVRCRDLRKSSSCNQDFTKSNYEERRGCKTKHSPTRHGGAQNTSDVDIHALRHPSLDRKSLRRSVQLPIGACSEPIFNQKTGLPISSSPAPLRRSTTELDDDSDDFTNGLSTKIDYRELAKILSRSAPASTTQSLLGNFEESILNGRMEPVGAVDGFTAELSASGSFCPPHVKLAINSYFYRLSDDDAPSPYMGYISLDEDPIGRKGYHIPRKGTIQLTVFNPNKTVVKIFVVLYDLSDMPRQSQTFLRQRTLTVLKGHSLEEVQPSLNYLLHLRFASSKSGRIYLHTDIRVIFARQPPDLGTMYQLCTVTDGPTDPKYTPRHIR